MKRDERHIDKLFNEAMNQRVFDIPESFLEDLNMRLDAEEKKRRPFFWWLALFGGIWLFLTIFFILQYNSPQISDYAQLAESVEDNPTGYYTAINHERKTQKIQLRGSIFKIALLDNRMVILDNTPISTIKTKKQNHLKLSLHNTDQQKVVKNEVGIHTPISHNPGFQLSGHSENLKTHTEEPILIHIIKPTEETNNLSVGKSDSIPVSEKKKDTVLSVNQADTASNQSEVTDNSSDEGKKTPNDNWNWEIQFFGGLGANFINDSPTNKTYLEKVKENQSSILAPSFGVNGNLSYKKLTFGLGLSYEQTGEKNNLEINKYYLKDSTVSEHVIDTILVLDSLGNWIPVIHDTTIYHNYQFQDSTTERISFKNTYSWISIPLHFGYRFDFGDYELIPRIGAQFNFGISRNKGKFPDENFNTILEYQAVKFNISYLIQLEARRNFKKWHVFINPYFKSMINPAISNDLIRRRYSSWGIQFGVGFKL